MRLLLVELVRFRSRRAVVLTLLAAAALTAVMVGATLYDTRAVSADDLARAQQQAAEEAAEGPFIGRELRRCEKDPESYFGPGSTVEDCAQVMPQAEWYLDRSPLSLRQQLDGTGTAVMILLLGVAVVAGTTFAGADWASGSMANQLLFEPRRIKVWAAKAVAVVLGTAVFGAALLAAFWGALMAAAAMRDIATPSGAVTEILQTSGRGVALAAGGALGAFALTMLFRSTVGALGLLFGYVVAGEALVATLPVAKMSQWALSSNIQSWLSSGIELYDDSLCEGDVFDGGCDATYLLTFGQSATYLAVVVAIAVIASILAFRQRDIP